MALVPRIPGSLMKIFKCGRKKQADLHNRFLRFFSNPSVQIIPFFTPTSTHSASFQLMRECFMDVLYLAAGVGLWGLMVLMVWGIRRLDEPRGGRP